MTIRSRAELAKYADDILAGVLPHATDGKGQIRLPGAYSNFGPDIDGLEGFTRTFMTAGFKVAGDGGHDPHGYLQHYAQGLDAGSNPDAPDQWVPLAEHTQTRVEAATLSLMLDITRPWLWDQLDSDVQQRVIGYLAPAATQDLYYAHNNWVWFRIITNTFLRSVGGPCNEQSILVDLAQHDLFCRENGWICDGEKRSYDHYLGWAMHTYPTLWAGMTGADDFAATRRDEDRHRLEQFLPHAAAMVGGDGAPMFQGRSLIYRFATAAPFWIGALAQVKSVVPGQLRASALGIINHFRDHGVPDSNGLLNVGWFDEYFPLAQEYSGTGSPYWASKGFLGLLLPEEHPVWSAPDEPLAVSSRDQIHAFPPPGWIISSTQADGVVRMINHGTDRAVAGSQLADDPFYARFGYSTATSPLLDENARANPLDQAVCLVDEDGNASHRSGFDMINCHVEQTEAGDIGVASSVAADRWVTGDEAEPAGVITTVSLVRGGTEVRLARATRLSGKVAGLRMGGWAVSSDAPDRTNITNGVQASTERLHSSVTILTGAAMAGIDVREGATPLGKTAATPFLQFPIEDQQWVAAAIHLSGEPITDKISLGLRDDTVAVIWPDGTRSVVVLPVLAPQLHSDGPAAS